MSGRFRLPEQIENLGQILMFDSAPSVAHSKTDFIVVRLAAHGDSAASRRELYRVLQQIGKHLEKSMPVGSDGRNHMRLVAFEVYRFGPRLSGKQAARFSDDIAGMFRLKF